MMKTRIANSCLIFLLLLNWVGAQPLEKRLDVLLDSVYAANQDAVGILIHVESPDNAISWTGTKGFSDRGKTAKLIENQPALIASVTKTYVAAAIVRLVEAGRFRLDTPIKKLIRKQTRKLLAKDGYDLKSITVRHLLSHTSGIADYVDDAYFAGVGENPQRQWTRAEQIQRAVEVGDPLGEPGIQFKYADINYLLLTEIIEQKTKLPFYSGMRQLLRYDELGLRETWFKDLESAPDQLPSFVHQYANNFAWDSHRINHSWDLYGGGGIAATVKDVALFYQYLFTGKIIKDETLLREMSAYVLPPETSKYCLGLYHFDFGFTMFYHGGWWGTGVNYSPDTNTAIAVFTLVKEKRTAINPFLGKKIHEIILSGG